MVKSFKEFYDGIEQYINNNRLKFKLGKKGRNWFWVFDEQEYFNNKYVHYEFLLNKDKISIDLHFERSKIKAQEFHDLCEPLPDCLEWKKWWKPEQADSVTHKNKVDLEDEDCVEKSIKALEELYKHTYSRLIEKVKLLKEKNTDKTPAVPLNQILFGAPGTGKTYHTKKMAVEIINGKKAQDRSREEINKEYEELIEAGQIVFTTFHQSLSYEDFIEGIKPRTIGGNVTYEVKDGIFKQLCSRAAKISDFDRGWNDLIAEARQKLLSDSMLSLRTRNGEEVYVTKITDNKNIKIKHKGGSGTEYNVPYYRINNLYKAFPDLSVINNIDKEFDSVIGSCNYTGFWAVLNYINNKIKENNKDIDFEEPKNHVLIIDEINRGNVSAIFGELITLLEEDKRKGNPEHIEVKLPYSGNNFSVPNNVYIIGTMNTADRSVEALDTALRRRFSFVEMQPDPNELSKGGNVKYKDVDLSKLLETINQRIEMLIDKDHQIGHSYFIGIQDIGGLQRTFKDKIIPLLEEYFYGDFGKIGLVLGGKFIESVENKIAFPKNFAYEKDFLEDKKIYHFTPSESWEEETFKSIYGGLGNAE
jgi:putative GTPase subunit of restriction endonuclease